MISCHNYGFARGWKFSPPRRCTPPCSSHERLIVASPLPYSPRSPLGRHLGWPHLQHLPVELGYQRAQVKEGGFSHTTLSTISWCCSGLLALRALFLE